MSLGSESSRISLIDLSKLFPFEIDDKLKEDICFGESLIVSCGHYEGDIGEESSDSEWSCTTTSETEFQQEEAEVEKPVEIKSSFEKPVEEEEIPEPEDDFHFFFFPDCNKPMPSATSVMIEDGLPKIIPASSKPQRCTCKDDDQDKCECYVKLECRCGAKILPECTCGQLKNICICYDEPHTTCVCKKAKVCVCHPDGIPKPICTCEEIDKPCVCYLGKTKVICDCKEKPNFGFLDALQESSKESEVAFGEGEEESEKIPCECQKPEEVPLCSCLKGKKCTCNLDTCICGVQKTCVCEPTPSQELLCKSEDSKSFCDCTIPQECKCDDGADDCKCFAPKICSCGNPHSCKCFDVCVCDKPCVCDTVPKKEEICECPERILPEGQVCSCPPREEDRVLKKVRAGKHGYRWCHNIDPKHTFFDYAYGRHDKIDDKVQELEKFKILGLHDTKELEEDDSSQVSQIAPPYVKKVRRPSLDCCSAVGGISISVETLGEDKDKFLVQMVSHSSKEGANTGSKLVSIVDCNLHTMEENRSEHIRKKNISKGRKSYMAICETGYYNKVVRICGERKVVKRFYHTFQDAHNFLLEGANVILLRYFGLQRYKGTIKTGTVLMDGTICESIYVCPGTSQAVVNGKPLFVVKIERHIIEPNGHVHQTLTVLTLRGYIVSHEWADSSYIIHLNPLLNVVPEKDLIEPHAPMRERWREDLQLFSDYLDFKSTRTAEGGRYMLENGVLTNAIRDYLQALLLLQPQDALEFTRHYFETARSSLDLPHNEYFESNNKNVRYHFFED